MRIIQLNDGIPQTIVWIRSARSPFSNWVRPVATLEHDFGFHGPENVHIQLHTGDSLQLNHVGCVAPYLLTPANLTQIQYTVRFWEGADCFPVYTLFPDRRLPWGNTIRSAFRLPLPDWRSVPAALVPASPDQARRIISDRPRRLSIDAVCPISLEPLTMADAHWTPCGHAFSTALAHALAADPRCPVCRAQCSLEDVYSGGTPD